MGDFRQNADGSVAVISEILGTECWRAGGPKPLGGPGTGAASIPQFVPGSMMKMGPYAGVVATTGGAIGAWTNNLGYDIIVWETIIDVTTASGGAANITVGQTATSVTTSSNNLVTATSVASTGLIVSTSAIKVKAGEFITLQGSASTATMVANLYLYYNPA